jgi:hypothetical protein
MYKLLFSSLLFLLIACNNSKDKPNTDKINVSLELKRFDKDFFAIDTLNIEASLDALKKDYPIFLNDYLNRIIGIDQSDSNYKDMVKLFIHDYKPIKDSISKIEKGIEKAFKENQEALKLVKYYFPSYKLPAQFITFIGPMDAFANSSTGGHGEIITDYAICSGLQLHLGFESSFYQSDIGRQLYPAYVSKRFNTDHIAINCMKNIIDDIFPPRYLDMSLVDIMIDQGKRMYLLDLFMPDVKPELKLGYTKEQFKGAVDNEAIIWNFFIENNLLFEKDQIKMRSFIGDGPNTQELGEGSPGFISLFVGKQIVSKYMSLHPETPINELFSLKAADLLSASKYKPK